MTDKTLKSLIDQLNKNKPKGFIFLRPISKTVEVAKVWLQKPKPSDNITTPDSPYLFYFIKSEEGIYVATVLDMSNDLHWYVLPRFRGKGHLRNALKNDILNHLFQNRNQQRITIDENAIGSKFFSKSVKVALSLNFIQNKSSDQTEYILMKDTFFGNESNLEIKIKPDQERLLVLRKQINYIARSLHVVQAEVESTLGSSGYSDELNELVAEIKRHTWRLEDEWLYSIDC